MDESKNDCGTFLRRRKGATGHLALRTPITRLVCRRTNAIYASSSIWQTTKCFFAWMSPSTVSYVIVEGGMGCSIKNASVPLSYDKRKNVEIKMRNIRCLDDMMSADLNRQTYPVLAPTLEFCVWRSRFALPDYITARNQGDRGLPEPSKERASSPAGFHRVRQSNPRLWPRHSRRITRPRNDHRRSPADLPVAAWETTAVSGPHTTRPRSRCNRWQWARLMGGPGRISLGSAHEGTTDTRTVWKECHALLGKP